MKFTAITFLLLSKFCFSQEIDCPVENGVTYYSESYEFRTKRDCWNIYEGSNPSKSTNVHSEKPISVISILTLALCKLTRKGIKVYLCRIRF